jgi:hypothetical protein
MKTFRFTTYILSLLLLLFSCKKELSISNGITLSAVTIINACPNSNPIIPDFSNNPVDYFSDAQNIGYQSYFEYAIPSGSTPFSVWQISDTTHAIFKTNITLQSRGIYSIFLSGDNTLKPDTLFVKDNLPYYTVKDSVAGVRFVNLSPGSGLISIDIQGKPNGSEVSSLPYKKITTFKAYTDNNIIPDPSTGYIFEFRDQASGNLLATYNYNNIARFKNVTIVFCGDPGNQSAFLENNY